MEIKINFDDELLKEYETRSSPPFFGICIQHDDEFYPSEYWMDFGTVILGWWIAALIHLLGSGRCQEFMFMDGPYEVKIRHRRSSKMMELRPKGRDVVWEVPPDEMASSVLRAAETVMQKLAQVQTGKREREVLERGASQLRQILSDRSQSFILPFALASSLNQAEAEQDKFAKTEEVPTIYISNSRN